MSTPFTLNRPEDIKLLSEYLSVRGLTPADFPNGLTLIKDKAFLFERGYSAALSAGRPYFFLQYLGPDGKPYYEKEDTGRENSWDIAKFLGSPKGWIGDEPPPKMIAPDDRGNQLHFEPFPEGSWKNLTPEYPIIHVESFIKAKTVTKYSGGMPSIGLNGVWSHRAAKREFKFVYSQYDIDMTENEHIILFDSNTTKKEVEQARTALAFGLKHTLKCKTVKIATLPKQENGEDWGPDDYLVEHGWDKLYNEVILTAVEFTLDEHEDLLQDMSNAIYCTKGGTVIDRSDKVIRTMTKARDFYANVKKTVLERNKPKEIQGFGVWLGSKHRFEVVNPAYEYLGGEFITRDGQLFYNTYRPTGPWPSGDSPRKDCSKVVAHMSSIMRPGDLELLRSYLKFLKYTPAKPTSFPILYSDKRGVGKGWISEVFTNFIGGENITSAEPKAFISNFNAQLAGKRLVVINEFKVTNGAAKEAALNSLKRFTGDKYLPVEPKGIDSYMVENRAGLIFTSNTLEDVPTDGMQDRRMWYIECHEGIAPADVHSPEFSDYWTDLTTLIRDPEVMNDFAFWVMNGQDVNFSTWRPPMDEARIKAIRRSSSGLDDACITVREDLIAEGCVVANYDTLIQLLKWHVPKVEEYTPKSIQTTLTRTGWETSEKKYGNTPATRRRVWVADRPTFYENEENTNWVREQLAKSALLVNSGGGEGSKY